MRVERPVGDLGAADRRAFWRLSLRQSRQLAQWGQLELAFLECGEQAVAFCYGLTAKGVFHSLKIGYDPAYADCAPGQLLRVIFSWNGSTATLIARPSTARGR